MRIHVIASPPQDGRLLLLVEVTSPRKRDLLFTLVKVEGWKGFYELSHNITEKSDVFFHFILKFVYYLEILYKI